MTTVDERVAALEAKVLANEKASDRAIAVSERAVERAEEAMNARFVASNEIRSAMQDQSRQYVTKAEFMWAIGGIVTLNLAVIGLVVTLLLRHP